MSHKYTKEQLAAISQVARAAEQRYAFDVADGDETRLLDSPMQLEMLRAEVQSFVLTSMMEHPVLEGWSAAVKLDTTDGEFGTRVEMNVNYMSPPSVDKVVAKGVVE